MWTASSDQVPESASRPATLVTEALADRGLLTEPHSASHIKERATALGGAEWGQLAQIGSVGISSAKATCLLGAGSILTEFLIAPVAICRVERDQLCSLGALANLMVVACDRLLDDGASLDEILPPDALRAGGGESSPVMRLLGEYMRRFETIRPEAPLRGTVGKIVVRMFEAEIHTVRLRNRLPYRFWLRKCSLPFVLMGVPAWTGLRVESPKRYLHHLGWLYRLGRFFGALDDAVDFTEDASSGQPNLWQRRSDEQHRALARRVADWAGEILRDWDSLVTRTIETAVLREVFLQNVWSWLEPARSHRDA